MPFQVLAQRFLPIGAKVAFWECTLEILSPLMDVPDMIPNVRRIMSIEVAMMARQSLFFHMAPNVGVQLQLFIEP